MVTESEAVLEDKLINKLSGEGYERINIRNEDELNQNFKKQLEKHNDCKLTDDEFRSLMIYLDEGSIFDKAKKLRDKYELKRDNDIIYLEFINQKDWCKNIFQISNQITVKGEYSNRYDVTILINGLPLVQIELKRRGMALGEAFNQIKRYIKHSYKGLFNYVQIFVISNGVDTKFFSNNTKEPQYEFTFFWKDEKNRNITNLDEFSETFLEKCNLAKMISKYMVLNESTKDLMILRAYQKYAVEALLNQALEIKQNGYIWHTTGSGKTITSFKASKLLAEEPSIDKVIFVVDRRDLDIQTTNEFNSFCKGCVDNTENTKALVKNLKSSKNKLVTTTIQKLNNAVKRNADELKEFRDKNIIFIFDECHRSQFGEMKQNIDEFFTNSLSYGFTGTPIFSENAQGSRTTQDIFGKKLHSYVIKDAIKDENVLGFHVDYYGGGKYKQSNDEKVKSIDTQEFLESENRISQIVDNIIESYDYKTRNREFNAIFAVASGGVIHKYYEQFKKKNHDLKVATIFTYQANEDIDEGGEYSRDYLESYIKDYNEMFGTNFSTKTFQEYQADISKRMKNRSIDILLVVNMFLTGFDSKNLNTLYIDKNLQYHTLLQAFSRTNRVKNARKSQGNIVTFRPIKNNIDKAIALFSNEDALETVLMPDYSELIDKFNESLDEFYKLTKNVNDVDALERETDIAKFVTNFRTLLRLKNKLDIFPEFTFNDLKINEQEFNDFKSKYVDIKSKVSDDSIPKTSILNDIDFELSLLGNDKINVDYILDLLIDLDPKDSSFENDKNKITKLLGQTDGLHSKKDLIEKFIDDKLGSIIENNKNIREGFDDFMSSERKEAMCDLVESENLDEAKAREIFDKYEFSQKIESKDLKDSFNEKLKFKERKSKIENLRIKIVNLFERFEY